MSCAAGELCQLSNQTPVAPYDHPCRGGCGGRLHGICGEVAVEGEGEEMHRICHACLSSEQASNAAAGKRKAQDAGGILKHTNAGGGKKADRTAPRTRLALAQKMEVLADLDKKATQETVADKFKCGLRTIQSIKEKREAIVREAALAKGSRKSHRRGDFPDVRASAAVLLVGSFLNEFFLPLQQESAGGFFLYSYFRMISLCWSFFYVLFLRMKAFASVSSMGSFFLVHSLLFFFTPFLNVFVSQSPPLP